MIKSLLLEKKNSWVWISTLPAVEAQEKQSFCLSFPICNNNNEIIIIGNNFINFI